MTLSPPSPSLQPSIHDITYNGETCEGVVASYDLLSLPGMMISVLADETATASTGAAMAATKLAVESPWRSDATASISIGTADSSALTIDCSVSQGESGGYANEFRVPTHEQAGLSLAAVLVVIGDYLALVIQNNPGSPEVPAGSADSNKKYG